MKKKHIFLIISLILLLVELKDSKKKVFTNIAKINILSKAEDEGIFSHGVLETNNDNYETYEINFSSKNNNFIKDLLEDQSKIEDIQVLGRLFIPKNIKGQLPAVIFAHNGTCATLYNDIQKLQLISSLGVAFLTFNSCEPRGFDGVHFENAENLVPSAIVLTDALYALAELAKHPRIDKNRIGILGVSIGGTAALLSTWKKASVNLVGNDIQFRFHIAFYPFCVEFEEVLTTGSPILFLLGENDTWATPQKCYKLADQLRDTNDVKVFSYKNARHCFDNLKPDKRLFGKIYSDEKCIWRINSNGSVSLYSNQNDKQLLIEPITGDSPKHKKHCGSNENVIFGGNREAKKKAFQDMLDFVKFHIR